MGIFTQKANLKIRKTTKSFALAIGLMMSSVVLVNAQTAMTWTGGADGTGTNFAIEDNWDPAGSPEGNILTIPMPDTTAATGSLDAAPYSVIVTGSEDINVAELNITLASEDQYQSTLTINLDNDTLVFDNADGKSNYGWTGVILQRGYFIYDKGNGPRLDSDNCKLIVEGGTAEFYNMLMGNSNSPSRGGKIYIGGEGYVKLRDSFGRMYTGKEGGQVQITENGTLEVNGNFVAPTADWINGGEEFTVARAYDAVANKTYFTAKPYDYIGVENSDRQVLKSNEESLDTLNLLRTADVLDATTFDWRYRADGETTFTSFTKNSDSLKFTPSFEGSGTFFVSCVVDGQETANEVEFFVVSDQISFAPAEFPIQFVRVGESGAELTAEFVTAPTSIEWKHSSMPGGPYESFDPAGTEASFKPMFAAEGNEYVVVEATINGTTHTSVELLYTVEGVSSVGKTLTWSGLVSDDASNPSNWNPVASITKNAWSVNQLDTIDGVPPTYPVWQAEATDTIYTLWIGEGGVTTWDFGSDSLNIRGGWQQVRGTINITSGYVRSEGYFRMDGDNGMVNVSGDATFDVHELLMSDGRGAAGSMTLTENAILHCEVLPWRVNADTLESVIYINDNAMIKYNGDQRSSVETWIDTYKIVCPQEGFEPVVLFDNIENVTIVKARDTNAFSIADDSRTFTTAGNEIAAPITLTNIANVTSFEWKYATNAFGPWESFEPAATDPSFTPTFNAAGDYYVVAVDQDDNATSNLKLVTVVDLKVTPSEYQQIDTSVSSEGDSLWVDVTLPGDLTSLTSEWFIYDPLLGTDEPTSVSDSVYVPEFFFDGKFEIYYWTEVQDADGNSYELISNSVKFYVNIEPDNANELSDNNFELYPNPANGAFYVNEASSNYEVSLIDANGRIVLKKQMKNVQGAQKIDFNTAGLYIVKVRTNNLVKTNRIVIE